MSTGVTSDNIVEMRGISKSFGRVTALDDVDFELRENEIHALLGNNGSGKSTLIKVLVGLHEKDEGDIWIKGTLREIDSPKDARRFGIATVYQDLALVNELSVAMNVYLARYPTRNILPSPLNFSIIDRNTMNRNAKQLLKETLGIDLDPTTGVEFLSGGERQAVAIARSLVTDPEIVIMDEPTSALSPSASDSVKALIKRLKSEGLTILVISHNLDDVFQLADRISVLNNGKMVGTVVTEDVAKDDVVEMMMRSSIPAQVA